jgi:hypothetical protein
VSRSHYAPERCPFAPNSLQHRLDSGQSEPPKSCRGLKNGQERLRNTRPAHDIPFAVTRYENSQIQGYHDFFPVVFYREKRLYSPLTPAITLDNRSCHGVGMGVGCGGRALFE